MQEKPTVLVVDDNEDFIDGLVEFFSDDYYIMKANNAEEAYALLEEKHGEIDVIVVDMWMPQDPGKNMDAAAGLDIVRRVCGYEGQIGLAPNVPILVLTGHSDLYQMWQCLTAGAFKYMLKSMPNFLEDLGRRIQEALDVQLGSFVRRFTPKREIHAQLLQESGDSNKEEKAAIAHAIALLHQALAELESLR